MRTTLNAGLLGAVLVCCAAADLTLAKAPTGDLGDVQPNPAPWGVLRRTTGAETIEVRVTFEIVKNATGARPETDWIAQKTEKAWIAEKRVSRPGGETRVQWAESADCYQLIETLARLTDIDANPAAASAGGATRIVDARRPGSLYVLEARGASPASVRSSDVRLTNGGTEPAWRLIEDAFSDLGPCWSDEPPPAAPPA